MERWIASELGSSSYGCIVRRMNHVLYESYGNGFGESSLFEIGSIRKSFNSALVGIGIERGDIDLAARAYTYWPEIVEISGDTGDEEITLHQLMSGTSGWLTCDSPGTVFRYNNAAYTAAERVVARIYGTPRDEIATLVVDTFQLPLAADSWRVYHFEGAFDPEDFEIPGPKLAIDSNLGDVVKWGTLWLNEGVWDGRRLIPRDWVRRATEPANRHLPLSCYGYNWYVNADHVLWPQAPGDAFGHPGFGGFRAGGAQSRAYLWVCPSMSAVAAIVTDVHVGIGNDYLDIPNRKTAEWIAAVVACMERG